jgi:hypothetical protein
MAGRIATMLLQLFPPGRSRFISHDTEQLLTTALKLSPLPNTLSHHRHFYASILNTDFVTGAVENYF